ncbi:MAG: glutamine amidotransferase [Polyangiaceae bacterium]
MSETRRRMLVLTTGDPTPNVLESHGPFSRMMQVAARGAYDGPVEAIDAREALPDELPEGVFLVITGSSAHVGDRAPWVVATEAFLRRTAERRVPTIGVCFGHQLLAQARGGEVIRNPLGREIGSIGVDLHQPDPILGERRTFLANATHLDTVGTLPPGAVSLARSAGDSNQIIRFDDRCYGLQFHPEIDDDIMRGYLDARRPILEAEGMDVDARKRAVQRAPAAVDVFTRLVRAFSAME